MKTPSDELFRLIKSLDIQEKVFFKRTVSRMQSSQRVIKLFDILNEMPEYDEEKLKAKLNDAQLVRNLKFLKSYAYDALLKILEKYHAADSAEGTLCSYIQQISLLANKRLFAVAKKIIAKAEALALEHNAHEYLTMILSLRRRVLLSEANMEEMLAYPLSAYPQEIKCAAVLKNLTEYDKLNIQVSRATYGELWTSERRREKLSAILKEPLLKDESKALSFPALLKYEHILGTIYLSLKRYQESYRHYHRLVELMEKNSFYPKSKTEFYLMACNNLFLSLLKMKNYPQVISFYNKIRNFIESLPKKLQTNIVFRVYNTIQNNYIDYQMRTCNFREALRSCEALAPSIKKYYTERSYLVFHSNLFVIHFYLNNFRKALQSLNEILNMKETGTRQDLFRKNKMLNLITHYELGNVALLEHLCKSTSRYLEKRKQLGGMARTLLLFFEKIIPKDETAQAKIKAFTELKRKINPLLAEQLFDDFDILSWIDSKIENRPFAEVVREKVQHN